MKYLVVACAVLSVAYAFPQKAVAYDAGPAKYDYAYAVKDDYR